MQQFSIAKSKVKSETLNTSKIVVSVWKGKTEFLCMSPRLNAWYLRALLIELQAPKFHKSFAL